TGGTTGVNVLFGSIFGLTRAHAQLDTAIAIGVVIAMIVLARPLIFASIDEAVAAARGVPVRGLGFVFLALVGLTAAEATQAVGALLLLGLLAAPAGAAHRLTADPYRGMAVSAGLAPASVWIGIALSYRIPRLPPSSAIVLVAGAFYLLTFVAGSSRRA